MLKRISIVVLGLSLLAACDHMSRQQQRALSGGAIGAGGGALIGAFTGAPLTGALIGGAGGAAVGALTH
jgi:osmotically inducible lipoprotein OsmB